MARPARKVTHAPGRARKRPSRSPSPRDRAAARQPVFRFKKERLPLVRETVAAVSTLMD